MTKTRHQINKRKNPTGVRSHQKRVVYQPNNGRIRDKSTICMSCMNQPQRRNSIYRIHRQVSHPINGWYDGNLHPVLLDNKYNVGNASKIPQRCNNNPSVQRLGKIFEQERIQTSPQHNGQCGVEGYQNIPTR